MSNIVNKFIDWLIFKLHKFRVRNKNKNNDDYFLYP
jgi:hypothetical protein